MIRTTWAMNLENKGRGFFSSISHRTCFSKTYWWEVGGLIPGHTVLCRESIVVSAVCTKYTGKCQFVTEERILLFLLEIYLSCNLSMLVWTRRRGKQKMKWKITVYDSSDTERERNVRTLRFFLSRRRSASPSPALYYQITDRSRQKNLINHCDVCPLGHELWIYVTRKQVFFFRMKTCTIGILLFFERVGEGLVTNTQISHQMLIAHRELSTHNQKAAFTSTH